jgi:hypothetical protein
MKNPAEDKINVRKVMLDPPHFLDLLWRQVAANFRILQQFLF